MIIVRYNVLSETQYSSPRGTHKFQVSFVSYFYFVFLFFFPSASRKPQAAAGNVTLLVSLIAVFRVSAASRVEVRALGKCLAQRPQAEQPAAECQMWSENWGFWPGKDHNWNWLHDGVRRYAVVQGAWTPAQLLRVYSGYWYVVSRLHPRWNCHSRASVSWKGLCSSAEANNRGMVFISPEVVFFLPLLCNLLYNFAKGSKITVFQFQCSIGGIMQMKMGLVTLEW